MAHLTKLRNSMLRVEGEEVPVKEVFFDELRLRAAYFGIEVGGWFSRDNVLIAAKRVSYRATEGATSLETAVTRDEVERGPHWSVNGALDWLSPEHWPPLIVGPFGETHAPLLLAAYVTGEQNQPDESVGKLMRGGTLLGRRCTVGPDRREASVSEVYLGADWRIDGFDLLIDGAEGPQRVSADHLAAPLSHEGALSFKLPRQPVSATHM